jgi:hypothetical protein
MKTPAANNAATHDNAVRLARARMVSPHDMDRVFRMIPELAGTLSTFQAI